MAEMGSGRQSTVKPSFRAVFTEEGLTTDALEAAARLFARWMARSLAPDAPDAPDPAQPRIPDTGRQHSEARAHPRPRGPQGPRRGAHIPLDLSAAPKR